MRVNGRIFVMSGDVEIEKLDHAHEEGEDAHERLRIATKCAKVDGELAARHCLREWCALQPVAAERPSQLR